MNMDISPLQQQSTMSSNEIADLTGKRHADVLRDIQVILAQAGIDERRFASNYKDSLKRSKKCYKLPRLECDLIISGYSVAYRLAIINRWHELEVSAIPSHPEALRLAADAIEKNNILEAKIENDKPKVVYADAVLSAVNPISIREWIKMLQSEEGLSWGERRIFKYLDSTFTYKDKKGKRHFYAEYSKFFSEEPVVVATSKGNRQYSQLKITSKGQITIGSKIIEQFNKLENTLL